MNVLSRTLICASFMLLQSNFSTTVSVQTGGSIPDELRASMDARLYSFVQAQRDGNWDLVVSMLGRYRRGGTGDHLYTPEHKACLISQMQAFPMISFTVTGVQFSSEILTMPAGKRWWYLFGDAVFGGNSPGKQSSSVVAYRDKGEWYFTPPNFDDSWAKTHTTKSELAADHLNEVEIERTPDSPLDVLDLHVFIDTEYFSLRNVKFKLRNNTTKTVTAFNVTLSTDDGSSSLSTPRTIDPGDASEVAMSSSRYVYFCDGVDQDKLVVDSVSFADGSEWHRLASR